LIGLLVCVSGSFAQSNNAALFVRNIVINGNKKTKPYVILREMTLRKGDMFSAVKMDSILLQQRLNIFNLGLFNEVSVNIKNWESDSLDIHIQVHERWMIIPIPIVKFVDRNVSEWWKNYNHDFKRLQYGAMLNWGNFTGRNDVLQLGISFGFAQRLDIGYSIPHFNIRNEKVGMSISFSMLRTRRIAYNTVDDKLAYMYLGDTWQNQKIETSAQVSYRNAIHTTHYFSTGYGYSVLSDTVIRANPNYFLNAADKQHYFKVGYTFVSDHRNIRSYPTGGWYLSAHLTNFGLGFMKTRMTTVGFQFCKYFQWKKQPRFSAASMIQWQFSWPLKQPYNLQYIKSLGYEENLVRGYELNVLDGQHFLLFKNEARFRVFSFQLNKIKKFKGKSGAILNSSLAYLPLNLYLTAYFDAGYVWDKYFVGNNNQYKNKWQFGYGIGLNFVTFNSKLFRIEYSANRYLKNGVYLHFTQPI
ncbi:MAG TPA: POTRA domain-containing protein, partial [Chitinophagales bacterium]|nr:POTRA domain-containing protein [Chitinophagales bacterium]